ncbi:SMI1/KNR4 family protein [Corallococcus aberystwythensis]|uniref:SMI1/KNR4 family protein n=2 Tax=Corallococcus aberystwythensis TaxID=2316722 RepID=A0A3A8PHV3_9BACT|nr:SMI1/KNR4 family protein [Corallococcus aberystwythensis]
MPPLMERLLAEVSRLHFPEPPATPGQIAAFEARVGWRLDSDLRAFYLHCNGASLFRPRLTANYRILSLDEIRRARAAIRGSEREEDGPPNWYTVLYLQDGDYIIADVSRTQDGRFPLLDAFHETFPDPAETRQVAASFGEFLEKALASGDDFFWLDAG